MRRVLVVKAGTFSGPRDRLGDYDAWFASYLSQAGCASFVWRPQEEAAPAERPDGIVISGSSASMTQVEPWIERLGDYLRAAVARRIPALGVCFGHQLLAQSLGGRVERHPIGREVGTIELSLTPAGRADPLFDGLSERFRANATHRDHVVALPPGAKVLAHNTFVPVQAFALGDHVRGVQFHPEYTLDVLRAYTHANHDFLEEEAGSGAARRVLETAADTPEVRAIFANFVRGFVER
jgi:GMP synthase (glutamine-hydrolysing)